MELEELTAYAREKFHIQEQHKWTDFPGFSVLSSPNSGKWLALLMRQWDFETGVEIQRCDIKCGQQVLRERPAPYLSRPFRMKGEKWVGVILEDRTDRETVLRLFDRAFYAEEQGCTIVLDTPYTEYTVVKPAASRGDLYTEFEPTRLDIPEKIRQMRQLDTHPGSTARHKYETFYRQGKFMEDYQDHKPWNGAFHRYFPTYHDLNLPQLRGYFTWRTHARKGDFRPTAASLAYIYLYELLNGIGTTSPEDTLAKLGAFERGFLDAGLGDRWMRGNLHRWRLEYAVLHDLPPDLARQYADPGLLKMDAALEALLSPDEASDGAIFSALCGFAGEKLGVSPVVTKFGARGEHLFADVWRSAWAQSGQEVFEACFGQPHTLPWYPLGNAVYWEEQPHGDTDYRLTACRTYHCRGGVWQERRYDKLYFHLDRLKGLLHEADRMLRKYLKTGRYLRQKPEEAWATPYVETAIRLEEQAQRQAARPEISLDLSSLVQIRQDADITRDSLLTEEEEISAEDSLGAQRITPPPDPAAEQQPEPVDGGEVTALAPLHSRILLALLRGEPAEDIWKAGHLMPSVVSDTINEALFDEIGDNVLECDGDTITLVEDYREDLLQLLGGKNP